MPRGAFPYLSELTYPASRESIFFNNINKTNQTTQH
nr:MAG TPA: hypothetical protein [Caudoviricetes sp.]